MIIKSAQLIFEFVFRHERPDPKLPPQPGELPIWSATYMPPAVGEVVRITINSIGLGTVTGYRVVDGYLGAMVRPHDPPAWYVQQNGKKPGLTYGSEMAIVESLFVHRDPFAPQRTYPWRLLWARHADADTFVHAEGECSAVYHKTMAEAIAYGKRRYGEVAKRFIDPREG